MKFNFHRFALTLRKEIADNRRRLLTFCAGSLAFIFIVDIVLMLSNIHMNSQALNSLVGNYNVFFFIIACTLAPSMAFRELGRKSSSVAMLMLPASESEKFICRWLLTIPCTLLLILAVTYACDAASSYLSPLLLGKEYTGTLGWISYSRNTLDVKLFCGCLVFLQSFFFLGSLLWPRFSWGKSVICLTAMLMLCFLGMLTVTFSFKGPDHLTDLSILGRDEICTISIILTLINYIVSYFRLRESEIINRR